MPTLTRDGDVHVRNNLAGTFNMTREVASQSMIPNKSGRVVSCTWVTASNASRPTGCWRSTTCCRRWSRTRRRW